MTSNVNLDAVLILQLSVLALCSQSTNQQKNDKNGPAAKLTFPFIMKIISVIIFGNDTFCVGKQCGS